MAIKTLTEATAAFDSLVDVTPETATAAADGYEATVDGDTMFLVQNTSADTAYNITFKYGNAMQGVADKVISAAAATTYIFKASTGAYKDVSGTNKGKILIVPGNVAVKVKAIRY